MFFGLLQILQGFFLFSYVQGSNSFPKPLTAEEEQKYLQDYHNGSKTAKNILIERNLRLVAHVVKKYSNYSKDNEDLISIGTIGLIKAITSYKPDKGTRLATYAARCIDNAMFFYVTPISPFRCCRKIFGYFASLEEYMGSIAFDNYAFENTAEEL